MTVSRWRNRLKDDAKFEKQLGKAQERCIKVCETPSVLYLFYTNFLSSKCTTPADRRFGAIGGEKGSTFHTFCTMKRMSC